MERADAPIEQEAEGEARADVAWIMREEQDPGSREHRCDGPDERTQPSRGHARNRSGDGSEMEGMPGGE